MKRIIKTAGLSLAILGATFSFSAAAAKNIGYVSTAQVMGQLAKQSKIQEKLQAEFKDRVADIQRAEKKYRAAVEKLKRDNDVLSASARTKLERDIQAQEAALQLKVKNLREDQANRSGEEQRKMLERIQKAVKSVAQKKGYDLVVDSNAVLFGSPKDNLSDEVFKSMR